MRMLEFMNFNRNNDMSYTQSNQDWFVNDRKKPNCINISKIKCTSCLLLRNKLPQHLVAQHNNDLLSLIILWFGSAQLGNSFMTQFWYQLDCIQLGVQLSQSIHGGFILRNGASARIDGMTGGWLGLLLSLNY